MRESRGWMTEKERRVDDAMELFVLLWVSVLTAGLIPLVYGLCYGAVWLRDKWKARKR